MAITATRSYTAARTIRTIFGILAGILLLHIILVLAGANPANAFATFVRQIADILAFWFKDLFLPPDFRVRVVLNYGIPALVYLVIGWAISGLAVRRWRG